MAPLGIGGGSAGLSVVDQSVAGEQLPVCAQLQPIFCRKRSTARRHRRELARSLPDLSLPSLAPRWLGSSLSGCCRDGVRSGHLAQSWRRRRSAGQGTTLRLCLGSPESSAESCAVGSRPAASRTAGRCRPRRWSLGQCECRTPYGNQVAGDRLVLAGLNRVRRGSFPLSMSEAGTCGDWGCQARLLSNRPKTRRLSEAWEPTRLFAVP